MAFLGLILIFVKGREDGGEDLRGKERMRGKEEKRKRGKERMRG